MKILRNYSLVNALGGIVSIYFLLLIPGDPKNAWLLGFSRTRVLVTILMAAILIFFIVLAMRFWRQAAWSHNVLQRLKQTLAIKRNNIALLSFWTIAATFSLFFAAYFYQYPETSPGTYLIHRIYPLVIWLGTLSLTTLLLLLALNKKRNTKSFIAVMESTMKSLLSYPEKTRLEFAALRKWLIVQWNLIIEVVVKAFRGGPIIIWVIPGWIAAYYLIFVTNVFFNDDLIMYFPRYVPRFDRIGADLELSLGWSNSWLVDRKFIGYFSPFTNIVFSPMLFVDFRIAYKILSSLTIIGFIGNALIMPNALKRDQQKWALIIAIFITGLISYGFQFELERGQFNVIAMAFSLAAIYIFHYKNNYRLIAYILFSISIQLKLWPAILILMFISDWAIWRANIIRIVGLLSVNIGLLFIGGNQSFFRFANATKELILTPQVGRLNHSITSFVTEYVNPSIWGENLSSYVQLFFFAMVGISVLAIAIKAYKRKEHGFNSALLLASAVAACLIPPVSNDYKLSILAGPVAIALINIRLPSHTGKRLIGVNFIALMSFAYFATLFSRKHFEGIWRNGAPFLGLILILITLLYVMEPVRAKINNSVSPTRHKKTA